VLSALKNKNQQIGQLLLGKTSSFQKITIIRANLKITKPSEGISQTVD
jgi:hypothetical protein